MVAGPNGAVAGRERHEQINRALRRMQRSSAFGAASGKARAVVDLGVERAKDIIDLRHPVESGDEATISGNGQPSP